METKVQKWGNSLGLRIPKSLAQDANMKAGETVNLSVENGKLTVKAARKRKYKLKDLLAGVNTKNIHPEIEMSPPVGKEVW